MATSSGILTCNLTEVDIMATPSGLSYEWSGPSGFISTENAPSVTEPDSYNVIVTDANGCTNEAMTIVEQDIEANIEVADQELCAGDSVELVAIVDDSVVSITWDNGAGSGDTVIVSPTVTTIYTATAVFPNGCEATAQATVTVFSAIMVDVGKNAVICEGESHDFTPVVTGGTAPYQYTWTGPGGFMSSDMDITVSESGTYEFFVTDGNGLCNNR